MELKTERIFADYFKEDVVADFAASAYKSLIHGHVCLNENDEDALELDWNSLSNSSFVGDGKPFVLEGEAPNRVFYIRRYYSYEMQIAEGIKHLSSHNDKLEERLSFLKEKKVEILSDLQIDSSDEIDWQAVASVNSFLNSFSIITGGPGTGKTTTVVKILKLFKRFQEGINVAVAAPTGKAAQRVKESLVRSAAQDTEEGFKDFIGSLESSTLHRLLGYKFGSTHFKYNKDNHLPYDLVIVDEASMIDVAMFSKLLAAINPQKTKIILLGDRNQLSSVEAGALFGDLCLSVPGDELNVFSSERAELLDGILTINIEKSSEVSSLTDQVVELKKNYRQQEAPQIAELSRKVLEGNLPEFKTDSKVSRIEKEAFNSFYEGFKNYMEIKDPKESLQAFSKLRVLCAVRKGKLGVNGINEAVEKYFRINKGDQFYENRPILITQNSKELGLFNGDIGIVKKVKDAQGRVSPKVCFLIDDEVKMVSPGLLNAYETAYAMTIHKSQGSEFDEVLMVLPEKMDDEKTILTRELIYTGATRAKKTLRIYSTQEVLETSLKRKVKRASGIKNKLS